MDFPRPHPGQKSKPKFLSGHNVKWAIGTESTNASRESPVNQNIASYGIRFSIGQDSLLIVEG